MYRRNYRNFSSRGRGGYRGNNSGNNQNFEFVPGSSDRNRATIDFGSESEKNDDDAVENGSSKSESFTDTVIHSSNQSHHQQYHHKTKRGTSSAAAASSSSSSSSANVISTVQSDIQALKNFGKQFQSGEKKNWPKYLRDLNSFLSSDSFPVTLAECPQRTFEETTRILTKIYLGKLYSDIAGELVQCATTFSSCLESMHKDFFAWIFSIYFNKSAVEVEETRMTILKTLYSVIRQSSAGVKENVFHVQKKLKKALEDATTLDTFLQTSELIIFIGDHYPNSLQCQFKDFIDILLGWFLDTRQPNLLIRPIEDIILSLGAYWKNDIAFSLTLLSQFVEDFDKYHQEVIGDLEKGKICANDGDGEGNATITFDKAKMNSQLHRMASLVRVYTLVLYKLDLTVSDLRAFPPHKFNLGGEQSFGDTIKLYLEAMISLRPLSGIHFFAELLTECNYCIGLLAKAIACPFDSRGDILDTPEMRSRLIEYCNLLLDQIPSSCIKLTTSSLDIGKILITKMDTDLPLDIVSRLYSPRFQQLKFFLVDDLQRSYFALQYAVLRIKSVPIVEYAYQRLLRNLKCAFIALHRIKPHRENDIAHSSIMSGVACELAHDGADNLDGNDDEICGSESSDHHDHHHSSSFLATEQNCLISIHSDLALLAEIANSKHSVIATWALNPSFIDLALRHISPCVAWLNRDYPQISHSFIYLVYAYCNKHTNFIVQSSLLQSGGSSTHSGPLDLWSLMGDRVKETTRTIEDAKISGSKPASVIARSSPSSSSSLSSSSKSSVMRFKANTQNSHYFADILSQINAFLRINQLCNDSAILCFRWIESIVRHLAATNIGKLSALIVSREFIEIAQTISEYSFSSDYAICEHACRFIRRLLPLLDDNFADYSLAIANYRKACQINIAHSDEPIADLFLDLFAQLPANQTKKSGITTASSRIGESSNRVAYAINHETFTYPEEAHLAIACLMHKQPSESFSAHTFQAIIDFILYGKICLNSNITTTDYLESFSRLFHSTFDVTQMKLSGPLRSTIGYVPFVANHSNSSSSSVAIANVFRVNRCALLFWSCWELVQFCIENRLKTPLGKPQDTFTKIEAAIKHFVNDISASATTPSDGGDLSTATESPNTQPIIATRIHMLLMIMENFDKLICNAISDYSMRLYTPSKLSRSFFRKNKRTCNEWINRNRRSIMILALKLGEPATVMRHGEQLLREYMHDRSLLTIEEVEFILLLMIDALIQLQAPEAVMGFHLWTQQALGVKFEWIKIAKNEANCRFENALAEYQLLLQAKTKITTENSTSSSLHQDHQAVDQNQIAEVGIASSASSPLNLITSNKNFICSSYTVDFLNKRILNCFLNVDRYDDAIAWSDAAAAAARRSQSDCFKSNLFHAKTDYSYLAALCHFSNDDDDGNSAEINSARSPADLFTATSSANPHAGFPQWDIESSFHSYQAQLFASCDRFLRSQPQQQQQQQEEENQSQSTSNETLLSELRNLIAEKLNPLIRSSYMCGLSAERTPIANLQHMTAKMMQLVDPSPSVVLVDQFELRGGGSGSFRFNFCNHPNMDRLMNSLLWHKVYASINQRMRKIDPAAVRQSMNDLLLKSSATARKSFNFQLAQNLLLQFANDNFGDETRQSLASLDCGKKSSSLLLLNVFERSIGKQISSNLIEFFIETSKLCHASGETDLAVRVLLKNIHHFIENGGGGPPASPAAPEIGELTARLLLQLVDYVQIENLSNENLDQRDDSDRFVALNTLPNVGIIEEKFACLKSLNHTENFIGKLLLLSASTCPNLAKAWYRLADWSYRWGRKLSDVDDSGNSLGPIEKQTTTEANAKPDENQDNVFAFYKLSANSYFQFLHISAHAGCDDVNATLRLLRLMLKHAPELREILETGLRDTPTEPWKNITLQLFSRLNHHESYVRQSITELLCRIGAHSPHLVIFPAVAGSLDHQATATENNENDNDNDDEDEDDDENGDEDDEDDDEEDGQKIGTIGRTRADSCMMQNCYVSLLETLASAGNAQMISQTKLFVHELRRITVLWDELWIGTLQHSVGEVRKQVALLEREIEKTKAARNLRDHEKRAIIGEQHHIFFRRILYSLELTKLITSDGPETPHERWFQANFAQLIDALIDAIRRPENVYEPSNVLYHYQNLLQILRKRSFMSNGYKLQMNDISPRLAALEHSIIPLPGYPANVVTLRKVFKTVSVLHTYTKPKKIVFIGSDGRHYTYLFKGHEDLHLDERIMQFLSIVNKMMAKFTTTFARNRPLMSRARHYSVTPLGDKSGLIQWVEGGQALYNFYKKWLTNREQAPAACGDERPAEVHAPKKITAVDIFKAKLAEKGIVTDNRTTWHADTLLEVHRELARETPDDLISKELWWCATNASDYWNLTANFITSNAIMSMIGYILGLGDRHLDNILLDVATGEVIHIDYNVCFEKGRSLRVPELVWCRLTHNIVNAFGITGVEGTFRISCEHVMRILRKGKETLLTLLEAFVYDPLIDWTPDHEEGYTGAIYGGARIAQLTKQGKIIPRKQMERENCDAIARLNALIRSAATRRNTDWPKISADDLQDVDDNDDDDDHDEEDDAKEDDKVIVAAEDDNDNAAAVYGDDLLHQYGNLLKSPESSDYSASSRPQIGVLESTLDGDRSKTEKKKKGAEKHKRNAYAFSVWKKIKLKLDGRDFDADKRLNVFEQVNSIIKESMDTQHLACMYEGWTSWV